MTEELNHKLIRLQILYVKLVQYYDGEFNKFFNELINTELNLEQRKKEEKYWIDNYFVLVKQRYVELYNFEQKLKKGNITDKEIDIFYDEIMNLANNEKDSFVWNTVEEISIIPLYVSYGVKKGYNDDDKDDKKKKDDEKDDKKKKDDEKDDKKKKKRDAPPYFNASTWNENMPSAASG